MRDKRIDVIKGVASFLVVIGHNIQTLKGIEYAGGDFYNNPVYSFIYTFHMPLFMLVSGYLFYNSTNKYSAEELIISKGKSVLIPIFVWTYLINLLLILFDKVDMSLFKYLFSPLTAIWFLWAIFYSSLGTLIGKKFFNDNIWFHITVIFILLLLPDVLHKEYYAFMYPYFIAGYYAKKKEFKIENINIWLNLIPFTLLLSLWGVDKYIYTSGITLLFENNLLNMIYIDMYRWLIGFVGSLTIIKIIDLIMGIWKKEYALLANTGKFSLGIYIIGIYFSNYIFPYFTFMKNMNEVLYSVICILISPIIILIFMGMVKLIDMNKLIRRLLLGVKI